MADAFYTPGMFRIPFPVYSTLFATGNYKLVKAPEFDALRNNNKYMLSGLIILEFSTHSSDNETIVEFLYGEKIVFT